MKALIALAVVAVVLLTLIAALMLRNEARTRAAERAVADAAKRQLAAEHAQTERDLAEIESEARAEKEAQAANAADWAAMESRAKAYATHTANGWDDIAAAEVRGRVEEERATTRRSSDAAAAREEITAHRANYRPLDHGYGFEATTRPSAEAAR